MQYLRDNKNCRVRGLDVTSDAVSFCKQKGIEAIRCDIEIEEIPGVYDAITLSAILEHLIDPLLVLEKLKHNLRDDGCIIILVPNFSHLLARIQFLLGKNVTTLGNAKEDISLGIQPYGHIRFFNKATLSHILLKTGYRPIEWSYQKSYSVNAGLPLSRKMVSRIFRELYKIDCPLFSVYIAVKAVKLIQGRRQERSTENKNALICSQ